MNDFLPYVASLLEGISSGLHFLLPEIALVITFVISILCDLFIPGKKSVNTFWVSISGIVISLLLLPLLMEGVKGQLVLFGGSLVADQLSGIMRYLILGIMLFFGIMVAENKRVQQHEKGSGDLYILLPAIALGLSFMAMSFSLLTIYISIEFISLASYLLTGYLSADNKQSEASMKYVLFGSACSAIMLFGISLLYGFSGTLNLSDSNFVPMLAALPVLPLVLSISLFMVGLGFKLAFVPMHFWSPDVYEGAPTPVTAFLSTAPKLAGFVILYRVTEVLATSDVLIQKFNIQQALAIVAILSMVIGNFVALLQKNIKRMLAYSSIGHTGFILMALSISSDQSYKAFLFYLVVYAIMNILAFALAERVEAKYGALTLTQYRGLGKVMKTEMLCFVVVLVSLTGLPPLAGFLSKFLIFSAVLEAYNQSHSILLLVMLIVAVLCTVVSLFYYLKIPLNAYLRKGDYEHSADYRMSVIGFFVVLLTVSLLVIGLFPQVLAIW